MNVRRNPDGTYDVTARADLLRRSPATEPIAEALERLHAELAVATQVTEDLGDGGRGGISRAMIVLLEFLAGQGIPRAALYPLQVVAAAIVDADRGVATAAFTPDRTGTRPPISIIEYQGRAMRGVVVECCIRQKKREGVKAFRTEGAKLAVSLMRAARWEPQSTYRQLLQLREDITTRDKADQIRSSYEALLDSPVAAEHPLAWAKLLLSHEWVNRAPKVADFPN